MPDCLNCGNSLQEGWKFCNECGTKLNEILPTPPPQPEPFEELEEWEENQILLPPPPPPPSEPENIKENNIEFSLGSEEDDLKD